MQTCEVATMTSASGVICSNRIGDTQDQVNVYIYVYDAQIEIGLFVQTREIPAVVVTTHLPAVSSKCHMSLETLKLQHC